MWAFFVHVAAFINQLNVVLSVILQLLMVIGALLSLIFAVCTTQE